MTRINVVPVSELSRQHLIAEYREITRLPKNLKKSLNRKSKPFSVSEIPPEYVLGKGHVKFFYDKFLFLKKRYAQILERMDEKEYTTNFRDLSIFDVGPEYMGDYIPTEEALALNRKRIEERGG